MHVLLAPDRFHSLSLSSQVAASTADGWSTGAPHDTLDLCPLSDGGPGFVDLLADLDCGRGRLVAPGVLLVERVDAASVVYVDTSVGLAQGWGSVGVGEQLREALACAPGRVVVGLGTASDTVVVPDGGVGLLGALGVAGCADLFGVEDLARLGAADLMGLDEVIDAWRSIDLIVAVATDITLLGLHGASASAAQAGALTAGQAQELERSLGHVAHTIWSWARDHTDARALHTLPLAGGQAGGRSRDLTGLPGAGAGAGLGWVLTLLGGRLVPGAEFWAEVVDLAGRVGRADLVVTVGQDLNGSTFHGSGAEQAATAASGVGVPCVVLAWMSMMNRRECSGSGISAMYVAVDDGSPVDPERLGSVAARVARSWSPRRTVPLRS